MTPPIWGHVPIPFGTASSSILTVVRALTQEHAQAGGLSRVAVSDNRDASVDASTDLRVDYTRFCPREWISRQESGIDHCLGLAGLRRRYAGRLFVPAIEALRGARADVVLVHEGHLATAGLPYWKALWPGCVVLLYVHTRPSRSYGRRELRRLLGAADSVVTVSDAVRNDLNRRCGKGGVPVPVSVVHNGVDAGTFHQLGRSPAVAGQPLRVTFAGEVVPYKGVHLLLEAAALVRAPMTLRVIGSGPQSGSNGPLSDYERTLRELAGRLPFTVDFIPRVPQPRLAAHFRESDVVVVPSAFDEPFGMVAREAMSCGATVIASRRGGLPEAAGPFAHYVDPSDTAQLAGALERLATQPDLLESARSACLGWASGRSWRETYLQVAEVVEACLTRTTRHPDTRERTP